MELNVPHTCLVDGEAVTRAGEEMPPDDEMIDLAELFKVFGDSTRVGVLYALSISPMCVCDLAQLLNMSHSAISHQLRILRGAKLVSYSRRGKNVYYSLADDHVKSILLQGVEHIRE